MTVQNVPRSIIAGFCALVLAAAGQAFGATLTNHDDEPFVLIVTERGDPIELTVQTGETIEFCFEGCFVALPNGNRAALAGNETIEISGGRVTVR